MRLKPHQEEFIRLAYENIGEVISRQEILDLCEAEGLDYPHWLTSNKKYRHNVRAHYVLPIDRLETAPVKSKKFVPGWNSDPTPPGSAASAAPAPAKSKKFVPGWNSEEDPYAGSAASAAPDTSMEFNGGKSLVPDKMGAYVAWGHHDFIEKIVDSNRFYPIYISGLSGNGKTTTVEQVCALKGREFFRVNINVETDEDDLLGGFRLIDGNTVFQYGPVAEAMRRGAVLLLDEVDLGTTKIMCLQSVLEGKGVYLKKINRWVYPAEGFQVFLTGNTKGQGSGDHDDKFVGTNVLNEAFLDRIPVMLDQAYPPTAVEKKILSKVVKASCGSVDDDAKGFISNLAKWAEIVRRTFDEGAIEDIITTRRLVQIVQGYCIIPDRLEAIRNCLTRFETATQESFLSLYDKIDGDLSGNTNSPTNGTESASAEIDLTKRPVNTAVMALKCSFDDRAQVRRRGALWNAISKKWYFPGSAWETLDPAIRDEMIANFEPKWMDASPDGSFVEIQTAAIT